MLIISLFLLWIIVILLVVAVIALVRQVRLLQDRDAPMVHAQPRQDSINAEKECALAPFST